MIGMEAPERDGAGEIDRSIFSHRICILILSARMGKSISIDVAGTSDRSVVAHERASAAIDGAPGICSGRGKSGHPGKTWLRTAASGVDDRFQWF
jgi:hypothetical protein